MEIDEIVNGRLVNPQIPIDLNLANTPIEGSREGYDIHHFKFGNLDHVFAVLDDNHLYKGYIAVMNDGHFIEAYVKPEFRKQGIMSTIMLYVLRDLKEPLYINSDDVVSDDSRLVLLSLYSKNKIKIRDGATKDLFDIKKLKEIFNSVGSNDYSLIIEHTHKSPPSNFYEIVNEDGSAVYTKTPLGEPIAPFWYD